MQKLLVRRNRPGENIDFLNTGAVAIHEGDVVPLGAHGIGIAGSTIEPNAVGSVWVQGVFEFPKGTGAIELGADVFWNAAANNAATTGTVRAGWAVQAAGVADATVLISIG